MPFSSGSIRRTRATGITVCAAGQQHTENKTGYLLSYLGDLTGSGLLDHIEVGFLPVGHTHKYGDIDQAFSKTSDLPVNNNAITLEDL